MDKDKKSNFPIGTILLRGIKGSCPQCGNAKVLKGYITTKEKCDACNESFTEIKADDGPAWLTIIVVGHILTPLLLALEPNDTLPEWSAMILWPMLAIFLSLFILPRAKSIFIAMLWRSR